MSISENEDDCLWYFAANSGLEKNSIRHVERRRCCQWKSNDDRRQVTTVSVYLCVQHNGCRAARRAGSSAMLRLVFVAQNMPRIEEVVKDVSICVLKRVRASEANWKQICITKFAACKEHAAWSATNIDAYKLQFCGIFSSFLVHASVKVTCQGIHCIYIYTVSQKTRH